MFDLVITVIQMILQGDGHVDNISEDVVAVTPTNEEHDCVNEDLFLSEYVFTLYVLCMVVIPDNVHIIFR